MEKYKGIITAIFYLSNIWTEVKEKIEVDKIIN